MGQFSWMYADTNNQKALNEGEKAYVPCPDGTVIFEECYDGYGNFDGHDIYNLVADWNRQKITVGSIRKPLREQWSPEDEDYFQSAMRRYESSSRRILDFSNGQSDEYMEETYGEDWKRYIGIDIACYDEDNEALPFPIKICKNRPTEYDLLPASESDPNQGWGSDEECDEDYDY